MQVENISKTLLQIGIWIASGIWTFFYLGCKILWRVTVWIGRVVENNSHLVHEWASTGRYARGNINRNSGNMIRQVRNALQPADKVAMVASLLIAIIFPPYGFLVPVATYLVFFHDADDLKDSSTILGYFGVCVSAVLNLMLFTASLVSSNRWRKEQF